MTNLPTAKSAVVTYFTKFTTSCAVEPVTVRLSRLATSDDIMTSLLKKLSISIKIHVVKPLCSSSKSSTESVGSRRELRIVFTPPTPTRLNSCVALASAVCIGH